MFGVRACLLLSAVVAVAACKPAGLKHDAGRDAGLVLPDAGDDLDVGSHPDFALTGDGGMSRAEVCDNGLDDDGDGLVDEDCLCLPDSLQRCYPGPAALAGIGSCAFGMQRCEGSEFGLWGMCGRRGVAGGRDLRRRRQRLRRHGRRRLRVRIGARRGCYAGPAGTARRRRLP